MTTVVRSRHRRPLVGLMTAETFSVTGTRLSTIAVPWLVLTTTGSATWTGVVALAETLPYVVMKVLAGPLVDRLGARRVAVTCDLLSVPVVALVPVLHALGLLHLAALVPIAFVMGALRGPSDGAKQSLVPTVAELAGVPLERVTGISGTIERFGTVLGAAAAGGLVALVGAPQALVLNAVTFAAAGLLVWWAFPAGADLRHTGDVAAQPDSASPAEPYRQQLAAGWRFLRRDPVLVGITMMVSVTNLLDQAWVAVLLPVWAQDSGRGAAAVGTVLAVFAAGSIGGALLATVAGDRLPRLPVYVVAFLVAGLPRFVVMGVDASWVWILGVFVVGGFASGFLNPILGAVVFERIPAPLVGRVSALNTSLCWSLIPFGGLVGGLVVAALGVSGGFVAIGAAYFVTTLFPLVRPSFREFGHRPTPVDAASPVMMDR